MSVINNALMTAAVLKSMSTTKKAVEAVQERNADIEELEEVITALQRMAGAFNDRLAVARAERDGYKSLTMTIVSEIKGLAPKRLSLPDADKERQDHLQQVYDSSKIKYEQGIMNTYAKFSPELRAGLLSNPVREKGNGKLIKDFD